MRFTTGILLIAKLLPVTLGSIHWTIGVNCAKDIEDQQNVIRGVQTAKAQALYSVEQLRRTVTEGTTNADGQPDITEVRRVAEMIIGEEGYIERAKWVIARLEEFTNLDDEPTGSEEPTGDDRPEDPKDVYKMKFAGSKAWKNLATEAKNPKESVHWGNIVIDCGPDLEELKDKEGKTYWYHTPRKQTITSEKDLLVLMKKEIEEKKYSNPGNVFAAITHSHKVAATHSGPEGDSTRVPSTITLHSRHLESMRKWEVMFLDDELLDDVSKPGSLRTIFAEYACLPVEFSKGLTSILLHEITHTPGFGGLWDEPNKKTEHHGLANIVEGPPEQAYGWVNNLNNKILSNPELLAFLAHCIDMIRLGYKVETSGEIKSIE